MAPHHPAADFVEQFFGLGAHRRIGQQGQVVAGAGLFQQPGQRTAGGQRRQPSGGVKLGQHPVGVVFAALHIRLVKGMQPQQAAGRRRSEFPAVELGGQVIAVLQFQPRHRLSGLPQPDEGLFRRRIRRPVGYPQLDEQAVVAITIGRQQRFAGDGNDAGAVFAQTFGQ